MGSIDWDSVFKNQENRQPGAADKEIEKFVTTVQQPLSTQELKWLREEMGWGDDHPETWILPSGPLPADYLSFLRWSNGGEFENGDRLIQFFEANSQNNSVRNMMLAYGMPYKSPGILPFAFNGGGIFYAFDMRFLPLDGEYKIVAAACGHAHQPYELEATFLKACQSKINFEQAWDEEDEITRPMCDECGEYLVCPECGKRGPVVH